MTEGNNIAELGEANQKSAKHLFAPFLPEVAANVTSQVLDL